MNTPSNQVPHAPPIGSRECGAHIRLRLILLVLLVTTTVTTTNNITNANTITIITTTISMINSHVVVSGGCPLAARGDGEAGARAEGPHVSAC